ncbi:YolD-like family protein [Paenibacillus sp. FSL H7-0326]|uniref:YolD-like family protein n=1 Tax=Paenibacillus sp. FSL H7-0326 TaxID=1921144 RepID=UPI0021161576|nr:YolD-like family protein [Paenibacillus sp. FSL H7-0326]
MKKLQGNGIFESSRMILPEYREAFIQREEAKQREEQRIRKNFDQQEVERIVRIMSESMQVKSNIDIQLYDDYEDTHVIGIVEQLDPYGKRFRVDGEWFKLRDIISIED